VLTYLDEHHDGENDLDAVGSLNHDQMMFLVVIEILHLEVHWKRELFENDVKLPVLNLDVLQRLVLYSVFLHQILVYPK
jgi:hypothetical protein